MLSTNILKYTHIGPMPLVRLVIKGVIGRVEVIKRERGEREVEERSIISFNW